MLAAFRSPLVDIKAKVKPVVRQPCRKFGDGSLRDRGFLTTRSRERRFVSGETGVLARQPEQRSSALARA
jgi:hypothetical protein